MLTHRNFRLRSLGELTLSAVNGETESTTAARPRHIAVLTVLALADRPIPRDSLLDMFWGGETETRARHSLSNALSGLRAILGADAIAARRDHVSLEESVRLEVDALEFIAACDNADDALATELYRGEFLRGIHVADAPEFEAWASQHRIHLERRFVEACERRVAIVLQSSQWREAAQLAERWLKAAPTSDDALVALLQAESGAGTHREISHALDAYDRACRMLRDDYGALPAPRVVEMADDLRTRLTPISAPQTTESVRTPSNVVDPVTPERRGSTPQQLKPRRISWWASGVAAMLFVIVVWTIRRPPVGAAESKQPIVAVTTIDDVRGDTSISWLRAGLPRMIATDLDAMGGVEVVAPSRVRDAIVRLSGTDAARLTDDQAIDVARRLGARWSVTGGVSAAKGGYLLDVTMRNVADASETESFTILSKNPIALGELAAQRLAALLDVSSGGSTPRYSGIETANPEAYRQFIHGNLAAEAEQFSVAAHELDSAIALDSGFVEAIRIRRGIADRLGDAATSRVLARAEKKYESRLPEIDRTMDEIRNVDSLGETPRAEALSIQLVQRFAHDPRSYSTRADLLTFHGRWAAAESVLVREFALDSLAMVAGNGPCTPCEVLWRLSQVRLALADRAGAESAARRWVALQPDLPAAWRNLSATLAAVGRSAEAAEAGYHMLALSEDAPASVDFGRTMLSARRYDIVDSLIRAWRTSRDPVLIDGRNDLGAMLMRERGKFAASIEEIARLPKSNGLTLVRADGLARMGRLAEARVIFERVGHAGNGNANAQMTAPQARGFAWAHALEADALARAGDTATARSLVDSIAAAGAQSYYGRDKLLQYHVRGMLLLNERQYSDAAHELRHAEWSSGGWTRTNVELGRALIAGGQADAAVLALRDAYLAPVDAMGRYVPRSELDWWMSKAFAASGQRDSASIYAKYVHDEWKHADAFVRVRVDSLPR